MGISYVLLDWFLLKTHNFICSLVHRLFTVYWLAFSSMRLLFLHSVKNICIGCFLIIYLNLTLTVFFIFLCVLPWCVFFYLSVSWFVYYLSLFLLQPTHRSFPLKEILHGVPTVSLQSNVEGSKESILLHQVLHHAVVLLPGHHWLYTSVCFYFDIYSTVILSLDIEGSKSMRILGLNGHNLMQPGLMTGSVFWENKNNIVMLQ